MTERQATPYPHPYQHLAVPAFILVADAAGWPCYDFVNAPMAASCGMTPEEMIGKSARDLFEAPTGPETFAHHEHVLQTGESTVYEEILGVYAAQGPYQTTLNPVTGPDGHIDHVVGTSVNISASHKASRLEALQRSTQSQVEQFVALAAHDLRTPMRNVGHLAEMLRDAIDPQDAERLELIDLLEEVASKTGHMIGDLLSHTQTVHSGAEVSAFDFGLMCSNLCDVLDPCQHHEVISPAAMLESDRLVVETTLRNLLDNAMKHGGSPSLKIRIDVAPQPGGQICIRVQNNGRGFENPDRAFLASHTSMANCGYGLMGIRRLLTARGGEIEICDAPDSDGACVAFSLPGRLLNVQISKQRSRIRARRAQKALDAIGMTDKD